MLAILEARGAAVKQAYPAFSETLPDDGLVTTYGNKGATGSLYFDTGGFVFVSGQIPVDPATGAIPDGAAAQAEQAFANVRAILEAAGLGLESVVKTTVFLADLADFSAVNDAYARAFRTPFPARSCVQVSAIPKGARLEVEAIAAR